MVSTSGKIGLVIDRIGDGGDKIALRASKEVDPIQARQFCEIAHFRNSLRLFPHLISLPNPLDGMRQELLLGVADIEDNRLAQCVEIA